MSHFSPSIERTDFTTEHRCALFGYTLSRDAGAVFPDLAEGATEDGKERAETAHTPRYFAAKAR